MFVLTLDLLSGCSSWKWFSKLSSWLTPHLLQNSCQMLASPITQLKMTHTLPSYIPRLFSSCSFPFSILCCCSKIWMLCAFSFLPTSTPFPSLSVSVSLLLPLHRMWIPGEQGLSYTFFPTVMLESALSPGMQYILSKELWSEIIN